jgi:trk system potassium uptake protein TrkH
MTHTNPRRALHGSSFAPTRLWRKLAAGVRAPAAALSCGIRARGRVWRGLRPAQQLVAGFASYVLIGTVLLCLPVARRQPVGVVDNLFTATSAVSTTGLTTVSVADSYSFPGELVILALFQLGGLGYMTISSVLIVARGAPLSEGRVGILRAGFSIPHYFVLGRFIVQVVVFTGLIELAGSLILWWRLSALGVAQPLWSAVFHTVSAFATAGFGLYNDSLVAFRGDWVVNLTVSVLCYLGAIGFIVLQDVWYSIKLREHMITFTSKVILWMTGLIFLFGTVFLFVAEPEIRPLPWGERLLAGAFQAMTASTTAGFNTVPINTLAPASAVVIMLAMLIGASPSGTGGGIKTTGASALLGNMLSIVRGRDRVAWLGHELPLLRMLNATAGATMYLTLLGAGILVLCLTERADFLHICFEAASALGTVGLSMGITGDLSTLGKLAVILLMFAGRCGPLTLGLALLRPDTAPRELPGDDLAV